MKIVFAATGDIAIPAFEALVEKNLVSMLLTAPDQRGKRGNKLIPPKIKEIALSFSIPVFQPERIGGKEREYIVAEAKAVVTLLKNYLKTRTNEQSVGVITFNSAQKDAIMDVIDEECAKDRDFALRCGKEWNRKRNGEDIGLFVKNIENVQGDERDCIIFSLGYAKNESPVAKTYDVLRLGAGSMALCGSFITNTSFGL